MKRPPDFLTALLLALQLTMPLSSAGEADDLLETGFRNPPAEARPLVWWHWINGNVTKEGIRADLEDMKRVGIGGAQILDVEIYLPPGPVRYGSDSWHEHVQYAIKTAADLGLELDIANSSGWSGSGGPWITPDRAMKKMVWTETKMKGGPVSAKLAQPQGKLGFYRDIAVLSVPATTERLEKMDAKINWSAKPVIRPETVNVRGIARDQVLNLTDQMDAAGKITTTLPPGEWVILRFGYTVTGRTVHPASPEGQGSEADKLDADTVAFQFEKSLGRIIKDAGPLAGKSFKGILFDSFEAGFQNWTEHLLTDFSQQKGYDLVPFLPVLTGRIIQSQEVSEGVLWDFRQVIEELLAENYFGTMHRLAAEHGLKIYSESQGGPLNPMSANRHVAVPMNEFWMPDTANRASRMKQTTSAAGFLGRNIIGAEAFTAKPEDGKYLAIPSNLKSPGDYAFTTGINRFILHHYTHQPVTDAAPGFALGRYGTHFGRLNTWWPYADAWVSYVSRCQFLLQQGHTVADVAILVDEDTGYGFPSKMTDIVPGYDFHVCYPPDLRAMSWKDGRLIHPQGQSFGLLITPDRWVAQIPTLQHLRKLVQSGAAVLGNPPAAPAGLKDVEARTTFDQLVSELWGEPDGKTNMARKTGAGTVYRGIKPLDLLDQLKLAPDLAWAPAVVPLRFIHRSTPHEEIYFVFNHSGQPVRPEVEFRQKDRQPEIWDAASGEHADAPIFTVSGNGISVPLQLEPWGSAFVVFRKSLPARWITAASPVDLELRDGGILATGTSVAVSGSDGSRETVSLPTSPTPQTISGPWKVAFIDGRGAPASATIEQLTSWSEHADPGIKYYSGTGVYTVTFETSAPKAGQTAILDLGVVADIARVSLNGQPAGTLWKPPFRTDVTSLLKEGTNTLEIRVANRWVNRLIGDEAIPSDLTYQKAGISKFTDGKLLALPDWLYDPAKKDGYKRHSFTTWKHFDEHSPLLPSGLLGPVKIEWFNRLPLFSETK